MRNPWKNPKRGNRIYNKKIPAPGAGTPEAEGQKNHGKWDHSALLSY